jgi:hypothetical protein
MILNLNALAILGLLSAVIHYVVARSKAMEWFWSLRWWPALRCQRCGGRFIKTRCDGRWRTAHACPAVGQQLTIEGLPLIRDLIRDFAAGLLACSACSGFWIGLGLGLAGVRPLGHGLIGVICSGLLGVVSTPVVEGVLLWGLRATKIH